VAQYLAVITRRTCTIVTTTYFSNDACKTHTILLFSWLGQ
jgi:hypothetical protein